MDEYIERGSAMRTAHILRPEDKELMSAISIIPAADVAPVQPGYWDCVDSSYWRWTPSGAVSVSCLSYRCSRCGRGTAIKSNYCPNCGARMDGAE